MADLTARIKPKKSSTSGEVPQAADLEAAELAVNTADGKLFTKHTDGSIVEISGVDRVVDQTDFGYQTTETLPTADAEWVFSTFYTSGMCTTYSGRAMYSTSSTSALVALVDTNAVDHATYFQGLSASDSVWFQVGDGAVEEVVLTSANYDAPNCRFYFQPAPTGLSSAADATAIKLWKTEPVLVDVDLPLVDGQVLTWVNANSQWEPAIPAAAPVDSVNGQTGVVALDLESLNNVLDLTPTTFHFVGTNTATYPTGAGGEFYSTGSSSRADFDHSDQNGADFATIALTKTSGESIWVSTDNISFTERTLASDIVNNGGGDIEITLTVTNGWPNSYNGGSPLPVYVSFSDPGVTSPTDGQVLTWVNANSQWEPGDLQGSAVRTALGIGEYADDTAAGSGGVASGALYYNTTSSDYRLKS